MEDSKIRVKVMPKPLAHNHPVGFSTIEIMVALAIVVLAITAVVTMIFGGQSLSVDAETSGEALHKAQAWLEDARATAKQGFDLVVAKATPDGIYQKTLSVVPDPNDPTNDYKKLVTANVTWPAEGGRVLGVQLATFISNPLAAAGGDTCNPTLSGNWTQPQLLGYADFSSSEGATDVDILAKKAYVTSNPTSGGQEDFYIFDVSDPTQGPLPDFGANSKLNTGPGLAAVQVAGKYAYVANLSRTAQLQIVDISTPSHPFVAKSFKLTNVTGTGIQALGNSVFYADKKVYLGLTKTLTGPEFNVIDVTDFLNDPTNNPVLIGSWPAGTRVNSITVKNNIAYIATPWPSSNPPTQENLSLLDVSYPAAGITRINTFTAPDPSTMSGESVYISKDGKTLYLGRGGLNGAHNPEFFSLNVDNPSAVPIPILDSKYIPTSNDVAVNAITIRSNLAFLWTSDTNKEFQIWDLNNLASSSPYGWLNTAESGTGGLDCDGNFLYTAQRSNRALQIIGPTINTAAVALDIHNTTHNSLATADIGDTVHAGATVTGSGPIPTGHVDFTFYATSNNCTTGGIAAGIGISLVGGVAHPSNFEGPLNAGSYSFKAHYGGDGNFNLADSVCKSLTIAQVTPMISTTIYNNATGLPVSTVSSGTIVYDKVTVVGSTVTPTGTVDFEFYVNKSNCPSGLPQDAGSGIPLSVSGIAISNNSNPLAQTQNNKFDFYRAHYNGDVNYNAVYVACEPLTVN